MIAPAMRAQCYEYFSGLLRNTGEKDIFPCAVFLLRWRRGQLTAAQVAQAALSMRAIRGELNWRRRLPARSATTRIRSATGGGISVPLSAS